MTEPEYRQLDPVEHMLQYPERDLGDTSIHMVQRFLLDLGNMKMVMAEIPYNEAVERLFLEILYNAADNVEKSRLEGLDPGIIQVKMSPDTIQIRNGGRPISCQQQPGKGVPIPEFLFGHLLTGSNFGGKARKVKTVGGRYGIGAKATNIFSTLFQLDIGNHIEGVRYRQTWRNNLSTKGNPVIESYAAPAGQGSYTQITYTLDFGRFYDGDDTFGFMGQRSYTKEMMMAFAKHCADASATANIVVTFNDKIIDCSSKDGEPSIVRYARLFLPELPMEPDSEVGTKWHLFQSRDSQCLLLDTPDQGTTISFVNSVLNEEGGVHVDSWRKTLFKPVLQALKTSLHLGSGTKACNPKEKDVANHISMILFCRLEEPKYKAQTKDKVTAPRPQTDGQGAEVLLAWASVGRLEEILKGQMNLLAKKTDGSKKRIVDVNSLQDALEAGGPDSHLCTLYVTEGKSAANFAIKGVDDDGRYTGVLPIKGKLLNVGTCSMQQYVESEEIAKLKQALGLEEGVDYETEQSRMHLRYGGIRIMTDQDWDGMHIRMLVLNFFRLKFSSLLEVGYVSIMETPYLRVKDGNQILAFFYEHYYDKWIQEGETEEEKARRKRCEVKVYKGLGSSGDQELKEAFKIGHVMVPQWDEKAEELMAIAFDEDNEDERKEWVSSWDPVHKIGTYASQFAPDTVSHLVTNQLCEFSYVNVQRSIPSIIDGLKECQRKVIAVTMDMTKEIKVSQFQGRVSEKMHYRYGDQALYRTIIGLGNYCVGTNNIPLVQANGQYDSRLGSDTASAARYIWASRPAILKFLFRKEDECILEYQHEGKDQIEPKHYYPVLPLWAINGSLGIGTGYSTNIPAYNPMDVMKYIVWWLKTKTGQVTSEPQGLKLIQKDGTEQCIPFEKPPELRPWYKGYQGDIVRIGTAWHSMGRFEVLSSRKRIKDILITEIPVTQTIETYIKHLDTLKTKPILTVSEQAKSGSKEKSPTWITGYKSSPKNVTKNVKGHGIVTEVLPNIVIEGAVCVHATKGGPLKALGLVEKISDTNILLLDGNSKPAQYGVPKGIMGDDASKSYLVEGIMFALDAYCEIRYRAYAERRKHLMVQWKEAIDHLELRKRFIQDVIDGHIKFKDDEGKVKSKAILESQIAPMGYPPEFLRLNILTLTEDGIAKLNGDIAAIEVKYNAYNASSPAQLWLRELEELYDRL